MLHRLSPPSLHGNPDCTSRFCCRCSLPGAQLELIAAVERPYIVPVCRHVLTLQLLAGLARVPAPACGLSLPFAVLRGIHCDARDRR